MCTEVQSPKLETVPDNKEQIDFLSSVLASCLRQVVSSFFFNALSCGIDKGELSHSLLATLRICRCCPGCDRRSLRCAVTVVLLQQWTQAARSYGHALE